MYVRAATSAPCSRLYAPRCTHLACSCIYVRVVVHACPPAPWCAGRPSEARGVSGHTLSRDP
eukprot:7323148-Prymnesium_polylepis.2